MHGVRDGLGFGRRPAWRAALLLAGVVAAAPAWAANPPPVTKLAAVGQDTAGMKLEWTPASAYAGALVLRAAASFTDKPRDRSSYALGQSIGAATVCCVVGAGVATCNDQLSVTNDLVYYYKVFPFDAGYNYAVSSPEITGIVIPATRARWSLSTGAATLAPAGMAGVSETGGVYVVGAGNDAQLRRVGQATGQRGNFDPVALDAAVQSRPMAGDLTPDTTAQDWTVFVTTQGGWLRRFSLDDDGTAEAAREAVVDAGCGVGQQLQAGPVILLDAYDANAITGDDAVVVGTRCQLTNNAILLYDLGLNFRGSYAGGAGGLGVILGSPRALYRDDSHNLVFVPVRDDGGESMVVLGVTNSGGAPAFVTPPFAEYTGLGDLDAAPDFAYRATPLVVVGNGVSALYAFNAMQAGAVSPANALDVFAPAADGPVKGLKVSTGGVENWVFWTTNTRIHCIKLDAAGLLDDATYQSYAVSSPSTPLVLSGVGGDPAPRAYVGAANNSLLTFKCQNPMIVSSVQLEFTNGTLGEPTFDYNDGVTQGLIVGSSNGRIYYRVLP